MGEINCSDPNPFNPFLMGMSITNITRNAISCSYVITNASNYTSVIRSCFSSKNDCLDNEEFLEKVNVLVFYFVGIAGGVFLLAFLQISLFQTACERQVKKIRQAFYRSIMRQEIEWFDYNLCGELSFILAE